MEARHPEHEDADEQEEERLAPTLGDRLANAAAQARAAYPLQRVTEAAGEKRGAPWGVELELFHPVDQPTQIADETSPVPPPLPPLRLRESQQEKEGDRTRRCQARDP